MYSLLKVSETVFWINVKKNKTNCAISSYHNTLQLNVTQLLRPLMAQHFLKVLAIHNKMLFLLSPTSQLLFFWSVFHNHCPMFCGRTFNLSNAVGLVFM